MSKSNDGGPAFPIPPNETQQQDTGWSECQSGMSLRDWFAGQALIGLCANSSDSWMTTVGTAALKRGEQEQSQTYARLAYEQADAMLAAREASEPEQ